MTGGQTVQPELDRGTRLAFERTFLAHERTQMAWVRTALSLISFGFAIAKFFDYLRQTKGELATPVGPQTVGILMIGMGLVSLALGTLQHHRAVALLRKGWPDMPRSLAAVVAGLLAVLGTLALIGAILQQ